MSEGRVVSVPLVNRSQERGDSQTGKYLCYVELPDSDSMNDQSAVRMATPYLRASPPSGLASLQIYSHAALTTPSALYPRIIEVPDDRSWDSVFRLVRGRSLASSIVILCFQSVLIFFVSYIAIKGYFLIKYGRRMKRH